jgi:hypothetical protein
LPPRERFSFGLTAADGAAAAQRSFGMCCIKLSASGCLPGARRTAFLLLSNFLNTNIHLPPELVKRKIKFSRKIFVDNENAVWYHIRGVHEGRVERQVFQCFS